MGDEEGGGGGFFPPTRWSLIASVQAGGGDGGEARRALGELCEIYWRPLYLYARSRGHGAEEAEDLVQGFFYRLIAREGMASVDRGRGRLRSYLLGAFQKHLTSEWRKETAQKRGGGRAVVAMDLAGVESGVADAASGERTPEEEFDRQWALALLERVMGRLEATYEHKFG